ncbi:hypothetical protein BBP40_010484 [Aspergillus hancockii]|nr:hypothetical protein BBP40_010484 [Aspergillus hancockii]
MAETTNTTIYPAINLLLFINFIIFLKRGPITTALTKGAEYLNAYELVSPPPPPPPSEDPKLHSKPQAQEQNQRKRQREIDQSIQHRNTLTNLDTELRIPH